MLRNILILLLLSTSFAGYAQETIEISNKLAPDLIEKYHVLKSNNNIKNGPYQALYKRKAAIAIGNYIQGKRTGVWRFYGVDGNLVQIYNYDNKQFRFVTNEDSTRNITAFEFIPKPLQTDSVRLPIKIGGLFYGYLPFLTKFKVKDADLYEPGSLYGILQILVTPYGQVAECKLTVKYEVLYNMIPTDKVLNEYMLDSELLTTEEKEFSPALVNHKTTSSTIYIYCKIKPNGKISIY